MASPLGIMDIILFVMSLLGSVLIGFFFANKNKTLEEFMLGGRDQRLLPVSLSMMTSFISGLTLIGNPAEMYYHGPQYSTFALGGLLWVPLSAFIILPVFYNLGTLSVYSYLEKRYSVTVKRVVSLVFMLQMTLYNAVVLYVPSLSLQSVFGISELISIGAVGLSCIVYSTMGGIKAVIWTDFFQGGLMYLSLFSIIVAGIIDAGGIAKLFEVASEGNRLTFSNYFELDLTTRHTIFTIVAGTTILNLFINGCNQIQVQRAMSLPSLKLAQLSQLLTALFTVLVSLMGSFIGLILYNTYKDCDPFESGQIDKRDALLIYHVNTQLASIPGLRGIFIAGLFAATLSTLSSFQNSMAALLLEDIVRPIITSGNKKSISNRTATKLSKLFSLLFGLACVGLTLIVGKINGLMQAALLLFGALGAPFLAAFLLGMLTRFVNTIGVLVGMLAGLSLGLYVQTYQLFYMAPLEPSLPMSTLHCCRPIGFNATSMAYEQNHITTIMQQQQQQLNSFGSMSYLWVPFLSFIVTTFIACLVSLATGGLKQHIDDEYLATFVRGRGASLPLQSTGKKRPLSCPQLAAAIEEKLTKV